MAEVGQRFGGRYRVEAPLARGGMGAVYRALDERLGRSVALKVMHEGLAADSVELTRFMREAQAVSSLHHPGLVQILDAGEEHGSPYLVMELVVGRTLAQILSTEGRLAPMRAADLVEQALFAISVAHGAGIVHRDLKPGNLMVVDAGGRELVKVLDFGIAQLKQGSAYTRLTQTGAIVGTPMFMAPEQVRGESCDGRTDVYAMGAVLWCTLTGRKPYESKLVGDILAQVLGEMPPRADRVEPSVPAPLASLADCALQKRREDRFATANAFALALAELRTSGASSPSPPTAPLAAAVPLVAATPAPGTLTAFPTATPTTPDTRPRGLPLRASMPTRGWLITIGVLALLVTLLGCALASVACVACGGTSPIAIPGLRNPCDRAADCCHVVMPTASSQCEDIRDIASYGPLGYPGCQQAHDTWARTAEQMGLHCD